MDNIRHLPRLMAFAAVAQKQSFTQAAEQLGITKSAVSQQVKLLERDLGVELLKRSTRGVSLTALGENLLIRCQLLQDQVGQLFVETANARLAPQGRFAVTFPHVLEQHVIIPALAQLCGEYPGLQPELVASDSTLDLLANHLDMAVHLGELPDSQYRALPIGTITEVFCATPLYVQRNGLPQTLEDLSAHRWIATSWQQAQVSVWQGNDGEKTVVNLHRFAKANTLPSALAMALSHLGMVLLPDVLAKPLFKSGQLMALLDCYTGPRWPVHTLHPYGHEKPIHIGRFHQLVQLFFARL